MPKKKSRFNKKMIFGAAGVLLLVFVILESTNTTHLLHKQSVPAVIPSHQNSDSASSTQNASSAVNSTNPSTGSAPSQAVAPDTNHDLVAPTGNFVSNHFPGKDGTPTSEASFCDTSPGATCFIKFTNVSTAETTQLPTQTTDARGATSWYWDTGKDAHLTSGQWKVTAVATLGSQSKTTDDALKLTIQ